MAGFPGAVAIVVAVPGTTCRALASRAIGTRAPFSPCTISA